MSSLPALALSLGLLFQMAPSHQANPHAAAPGSAESVVPPVPPSQPEKAAGLAWKNPKAWTAAASPSAMRVVTLKVPAAPGDGEPGELAVFYFGPGQGGGVEANVSRWFAQFQPEAKGSPEKQSKTAVGEVPVTLCQTEGTYVAGMGGVATAPKAGWALRGAIAEGPQGSVFFKLVGPKKTVEKAQPAFDALVKSIHKG